MTFTAETAREAHTQVEKYTTANNSASTPTADLEASVSSRGSQARTVSTLLQDSDAWGADYSLTNQRHCSYKQSSEVSGPSAALV
jgi:hypothetical protein